MRSRLVVSVLLVVVLCVAATAEADRWYEHYARAEAALEAEDWSTAVTELNLALERRGDSGARVRTYGMRVTPYFPYLKLGIAFYHSEQLEAATRAFETEERLGAVLESPAALAELRRYQKLATEALQRLQVEQGEKVAEIVRESLAQAAALQQRGELYEALGEIGRALSVAPDNQEANALAGELRAELADREDRQARSARAVVLVEEGIQLRAGGRLGEAAASFRQAVEISPESEAGDLLEQVQTELEARASESSAQQRDEVMRRAREQFDAGDLKTALTFVQELLGAGSQRSEARALERQILDALSVQSRRNECDGLLGEARRLVAQGDHERAIISANLVLAREQGNPDALQLLRVSYQELSRKLLGAGDRQNLPPAIHFADLREERPDGVRLQVVREPAFRLSGVVLDETPVSVMVIGQEDLQLQREISSQSVGGVHVTEFRVSAVLPAGMTTLQLVATDDEGLGTRSEYSVQYRPGILRSSWVWGGIGFGLLMVACVWAGWKQLRRRKLLRRRFNPFVAGPPVVGPEQFFGREQLVERILATIPYNSLLLLGERRIGKTSLLHQLHRRLESLDVPACRFKPVYMDLQGTPQETFFSVLGDAILQGVTGEGLTQASYPDGYSSRELVNDIREVLSNLQRTGEKPTKLVLLIDEIDELNEYSHRTNQRLRSLFMRSFADQLVAVAAGVGIQRQWDHQGSPWYNFFEELKVGPLDEAAARELVTRPLAGVMHIDPDAVDRLIDSTGGRPYLLQKTALGLVQRAHERGRRRITAADVDAILGGKLQNP